jgi:hypothetical protein
VNCSWACIYLSVLNFSNNCNKISFDLGILLDNQCSYHSIASILQLNTIGMSTVEKMDNSKLCNSKLQRVPQMMHSSFSGLDKNLLAEANSALPGVRLSAKPVCLTYYAVSVLVYFYSLSLQVQLIY